MTEQEKDAAEGQEPPAGEQPEPKAEAKDQGAAEGREASPAEEKPTPKAERKKPAREEQPKQPAEAKAKAEGAKELPGGASPQRPGLQEKPEGKAPAREPPPPGSVAELFTQALPDVQLEAYQGLANVVIEVGRDDVPKVMQVAKEDPRLDLKFLRCLFGVDHMEDGLEVVYQLLSYEKGHEVTIKTSLPQDDPKVASVTSVWKGANWHERETRDMFGIEFEGHPHLVPLLLPEDMTDHFPLRKDNALAEIAEWQGELLAEGTGNAGGEEEVEE